MFDKEEFYREFGNYLGVPSDVAIISIDEEAFYREGCPTCGGDYEYTVYVSWIDSEGFRVGKSYDGRLSDFINSL